MRIAAGLAVALTGLAASEWLQDATKRLESYCWRQHIFTKPIDYSIPNRPLVLVVPWVGGVDKQFMRMFI